jgi:GH25 family lysozyme M1 (1,4-beta-N-acetylmuramidase)
MLIGADYARVDANFPPDFEAFKLACRTAGSAASFVIFRGAWGTSEDLTVQRDWVRAKAAGLTCGAYLLLRMRKDILPEDQVHVFADNVGTLRSNDLVPIIDVEDTGLTAEAELDWVHRAWLEIRRIYGAPPIIYDSDRVWREDLHDLPAGEMTDSPQWVAKPWPWPRRRPAQLRPFQPGQYEPTVPKPWGPGNWWMHQYQGDAYPVAGFSSTVDLSRWNVMRQGQTGERVRWAQRRLGMAVTGTFDADMANRVKAFQASAQVAVDGAIGPKTFAPLAWCNGVERPLSAA